MDSEQINKSFFDEFPPNIYTCEFCGYHVSRYALKITLIRNMKIEKVRACQSCIKNKLQKYFSYYMIK